jgi:hypothetical protein
MYILCNVFSKYGGKFTLPWPLSSWRLNGEGRGAWQAFVNTGIDLPSGSPEGAGYFKELSDRQFGQKYSASFGWYDCPLLTTVCGISVSLLQVILSQKLQWVLLENLPNWVVDRGAQCPGRFRYWLCIRIYGWRKDGSNMTSFSLSNPNGADGHYCSLVLSKKVRSDNFILKVLNRMLNCQCWIFVHISNFGR